MMNIISTIAQWLGGSWLGKLILDFVWGRLVAYYQSVKAQMQKDKVIDQDTKREAEAVKDAKTVEELEKAAEDILGRN